MYYVVINKKDNIKIVNHIPNDTWTILEGPTSLENASDLMTTILWYWHVHDKSTSTVWV